MTEGSKRFDLEDRTFGFAKDVRDFLKKIPRSQSNLEYSKQLIRSSASVGANYIEANESFSKKYFVMRIKICRKEAKETRYWLRLIEVGDQVEGCKLLVGEFTELMNIFGSIIRKSETKNS